MQANLFVLECPAVLTAPSYRDDVRVDGKAIAAKLGMTQVESDDPEQLRFELDTSRQTPALKSAMRKLATSRHAKSRISATPYRERCKAIEYARWLAKRDGIEIPFFGDRGGVVQGVIVAREYVEWHGYKGQMEMPTKVRFCGIVIRLPNWDFDPTRPAIDISEPETEVEASAPIAIVQQAALEPATASTAALPASGHVESAETPSVTILEWWSPRPNVWRLVDQDFKPWATIERIVPSVIGNPSIEATVTCPLIEGIWWRVLKVGTGKRLVKDWIDRRSNGLPAYLIADTAALPAPAHPPNLHAQLPNNLSGAHSIFD